ncbi:MAG: PAS domain S-box protein [Gammaproteobacteria bacterium]|nr:MAG: PAS domain S-box protein [Gammaproteobacteria bacterium]
MIDTDSSDEWSKLAYWMRHAAFEQCPEPLMLLDPLQNQYIDCNIAATDLLGFSRAEILKMPISYIHGRELGQLIVFTQEAMAKGHAKSKRISCRLKSDIRIPVELSASRTVIKGKEYLVVSIKDIDSEERSRDKADADRIARNGILEWKHVQSIFQQGERENLLMLTSVGDGIYCVDTNGMCTFINPAAKRLLGRTDGDVLGQNIHYVHHHTHEDGTHYPVEECPIYAAIRDGIVHEGMQEVFWKHDGTPFPVEFTSTPIISEGSIIGAVVVFRDISQRMETEKQLREALKELSDLKVRLEDENAYLQQEILIEQRYHGIIGESAAIKRIHQQIQLVAQTEANVLITGESGTGKELIARAIHEASDRKDKPMIRVNCAAIPHELFESEFFGHIRGAFTGAVRDRIGRFELANGGTLFLDEVGEIPLELQSKLLRVLQEGQLERVGEEKTRNVDVRVIAATNKDLKKEAEAHHFREDLYFRLNVFPIHSPPLRERGNDIALLATHFLEQANQKFGKKECKLRQGDLRQLLNYDWPGNIRELQNVMERAVITSENGRVPIDLPTDTNAKKIIAVTAEAKELIIIPDDEMQERVKHNMLTALEKCDWKLFGEDGAAVLLGLKPTTLASRIKRLGLRPPAS